jgi:glutamate N-acetyltransferase/amino-acid N-acetyltransferase
MGGIPIFSKDCFQLDPDKEKLLSDYLFDCQLFPSESLEHDRNYPPHDKCVDISIAMNSGFDGSSVVIGSDLTKEYVEVNADYRS